MHTTKKLRKNVTGELTKDEFALRRELHRVIKKVTEDLDNNFNFNTAISAIMELVNAMYAHKDKADTINSALANELTRSLLLLLAPFVPHITEELWHELGETTSIHTEKLACIRRICSCSRRSRSSIASKW